MDEETNLEICPLCHERHESMSLYGIKYIGCSFVPEDTLISKQTLDLFFQDRCVLEQPLVIS